MTCSAKAIDVDKSDTDQRDGKGCRTAHCQGAHDPPSCAFYRVEQEDGKNEGLNEGVDQHKVDGEVCGLDEWMVWW